MSLLPNVQKVHEIRGRIAEISDELAKLEREYISEAEALQKIDLFIETQAQLFSNEAGAFLSPDRMSRPSGFFAEVGRPGTIDEYRADIAPVLCAMFPEVVRENLVNTIHERYGKSFGRPLAERPAIREELIAERLSLEIQEEQLIQQSIDSGSPIERRIDFENVLLIVMKNDVKTEVAA